MSKKHNYREEAIPLVEYDQSSSKYIVNEEALEYIAGVPGPIGVVGVAGMYRTGKSYLLNQMLLNRSDGFGIGPTVNPCTKGLWIWGRPLLGQSQDGENINIFVIDSEGIGALDEDSTHDSRIFALTVLLSSCFIYNSTGSIDEQAIQNLSLIANLTKNIQFKLTEQSLEQEVVDYEDFSKHFPQFIWVVRDFSLMLTDQNDKPITQKEYLEMALQDQTGQSESVQQKNKIRKCLREFFRDRDCQTLVRPLTNEENLQKLEQMSFEELRPEFFEQVINLRKKILSRLRVKTMLGQPLNGEMYQDLIRNYIHSINEGAVPNIQSAWTYLCQNQCQKAVQTSMEVYDLMVRDLMHNKLPTTIEELKELHQQAKHMSIQSFLKKAIGNYTEEIELLKKQIKNRFQMIRVENQKESVRLCQNYITSEYQTIDRKLKLNEYRSFHEFTSDMNLFQQYFLENGPQCEGREECICQYLQKAVQDAGSYFIKSQAHESTLQKTLAEEAKSQLETDLKDVREQFQREKLQWQKEFSKVQQDRAEQEVIIQSMEERLEESRKEKDQLEEELKQQFKQEKQEILKEKTTIKMRLAVTEEKSKEMERMKVMAISEFDKERALLQQKIDYYEKTLEESSKKEKDVSDDVKNVRKEKDQQIKELQQKFEQMQRSLQQRVNDLLEKVSEGESLLMKQQMEMQKMEKEYEIREQGYQSQKSEWQQRIQQLEQQAEGVKKSQKQDDENLKLRQENEYLHRNREELEEAVRQREDLVASLKSQVQKEKAILQQKVEFLEVQNKEAKQQLEENKRAHEAIMSALSSQQQQQDGQGDKGQGARDSQVQSQLQQKLKMLEVNNRQISERLDQQLEKNHELETHFQLERNELEKQIEALKEELSEMDYVKQRMNDNQRITDSEIEKKIQETEERYRQKIRYLEEELEQIKNQGFLELREVQQKSENSLASLKNIYDIERETLERRIAEERERWDKKFQNINEEYYEKIRQDQQNYEEEIEQLKEELRETEGTYTHQLQQYDHELALKQQSIDTLEKYIAETKQSLVSLQNSNNSAMEHYLNNFANERKMLQDKIDQLSLEIQKKEKENLGLIQKKEYFESQVSRKESSLETIKKEKEHEKSEFQDKMEATKQKLQEAHDQLLDHKIQYSKEIALSQQKNEFLEKRNEELQRQYDNTVGRYEERLNNMKSELNEESHQKLEKEMAERQQLETKYEKVKKSLKEVESTYNKQLAQLEKERAVAVEKLQQSEQKRKDFEVKLQTENQQLMKEVGKMKDQISQQQKNMSGDVEKWRVQNLQLEQEKNDILTNYDRDRALWEGKFQFLEQQKEQAKQDLVDALRKFELTLQHLQKARSGEKEEHEQQLNELLLSMEKKYQAQMNEQQENFNRQINDYDDKIKRLQKELKQMKEHSYIEKFGKAGNQLMNEKKLAEFLENEKRMLQEIDQLKADREQKQLDHQRNFEQERENFKEKIAELEKKYRESESKRNQMMFDVEKERTKWKLEKDHLIQQKQNIEEEKEKLEKKKEQLVRDNEKLRTNSRSVVSSNVNNPKTKEVNLFSQGLAQMMSKNNNVNYPSTGTLLNNNGNNQSRKDLRNPSQDSPNSSSASRHNLDDITNYNILGGITSQKNKFSYLSQDSQSKMKRTGEDSYIPTKNNEF